MHSHSISRHGRTLTGALATVLAALAMAGPAGAAETSAAIVPDAPDRSVVPDAPDRWTVPDAPDRWIVPDAPDRWIVPTGHGG